MNNMTPVKIPMLDIAAQHAPLRGELESAIKRVLDHGLFIMGPEIAELETAIADYSGVKYAIGVSSGTDALLIALMALDIKSGDEVIVPDYSFFATAGVVARLGATPVFTDIDPVTFNINPALIEAAITTRTKAIIPVHLFGQCADMAPILAIAQKHNLYVIEDAAQAIGACYKDGRKAGSMGDIGCFSFFPSKNLGAAGDAGMVVTNDDTFAEKLRILRSHGAKPKYHHKIIGGNFRLDTIHAAILLVKLKYLDKWTKARQANADRYTDLFKKSGLDDAITTPKAVWEGLTDNKHIYNQFVVRLKNRDEIKDALAKAGISSEIYYPVPFHAQECFEHLQAPDRRFSESTAAAANSLALPISSEITPAMQVAVVEAMLKALG